MTLYKRIRNDADRERSGNSNGWRESEQKIGDREKKEEVAEKNRKIKGY